jgi:hypothetical protein
MQGSWNVTSQFIGETKMFAVYRLRDTNAVDHSGNREFASEYLVDRGEAESIAKGLNESEET